MTNNTPAGPTAANGEVTAAEDTAHGFTAASFNFQPRDGDHSLASVKITALPASGTGTLSVDGAAIAAADLPKTVTSTELDEGKLEYSPPANANGDTYASFSFKVNDGTHDSASAYTMTIDVTAVNDAATGLPTLSGTASEGATLTADVSGIADAADGLTKAGSGDAGHAFAYAWLRVDGDTETVIAHEVASTYELAAADVGKKIKVRVSFTDDDGHAETLTGAAWPSSGSVAARLTASFENGPPNHDGETQFNVNLRFSRKIERLSYLWLRDHLLSATGARVVSASRENPPDNQGWLVTLAPTGTGDVTLRLPALACDAQYAVCAGGAPLAGPASVTIAYAAEPSEPAVETFGVTFIPGSHQHGGAGGAARFYLSFQTEPHGLSYRDVAARALSISGATASRVKRMVKGKDRDWEVKLAPAGDEDIVIAVKTTTDCETGVCTAKGAMLASDATLTIPRPSRFSVADARVEEAAGAQLVFTVTLSPARGWATSTVAYATSDGTATAGSDYTAASGRLTFAPGESTKTVSVAVLDDVHDEGEETVTLTLSNPSPSWLKLADATATGTITNTDAMPQAWTARFGRTVAEQVLGAVESRMRAARTPGVELSLAGERIGWRPGAEAGAVAGTGGTGAPRDGRLAAGPADWLRGSTERDAGVPAWTMTGRELLLGASFNVTAQAGGPGSDGGTVAVWGRGAVSSFDGRDGDLGVDGEVASAMLGADWSRGRVTAGLVVGHSAGEGGYGAPAGSGVVSSALTGLWPWGRYALTERVEVWGAAGYGEGTLTLEPAGQDAVRTDLDLGMAAAGLRGTLIEGGADGFTLAAKTDAMTVQTSTDAVVGELAASDAGVTRLRLGLEGSLPVALGDGSVLTPSMEVGVRHDGGDAETGFGADIGGGLAWRDPKHGLNAEIRGRGLLTHESKGLRERGLSGALGWDPVAGGRGPSFSLTQTFGGASSGGADALLRRGTLEGLAAHRDEIQDGDDDLGSRRLDARFGYGFSAFGGGFTFTPEAGVGLSDTGRDYRLGWRLVRIERGAGPPGASLELSFGATRRESTASDDVPPEHGVGLRLTSRF